MGRGFYDSKPDNCIYVLFVGYQAKSTLEWDIQKFVDEAGSVKVESSDTT